MKRLNRLFLIFTCIFTIIVALVVFFVKNINDKNSSIGEHSRYLIFGKENIIAVYEDKMAIKIPYEIQVDKKETFKDLVKMKNYDKALEVLNKNFPEKISVYRVVKYGNVELEAENMKNVPETTIDDKRYILNSSLDSMFKEMYSTVEKETVSYSEAVIDVLNAKGKSGYARTVGEKLKKKLGIKYNAANYEKKSEESFIIINNFSKEQVEEIVSQLDEKYLKVQKSSNLPTLANLIIVLGNENDPEFEIDIYGKSEDNEKILKTLKDSGYKKLKGISTNEKNERDVIEYGEDDYFIAYKIGEKLNIKNLVKKDEYKDKIRIRLAQ
ncbi:MAG: LytR C-terminal domain-containing protein [Fusobacteriaceae bacterium]